VFSDSGALSDLNAIVHPQVRRLAAERIAVARAVDPDAVIVYEIPLLAETEDARGIKEHWDFVVVADAPEEQRIQRMVSLRGMAEADARNRIMNQASDEQRRAIADVVIDTSGSEADTLAQVDALWDQVTAS
jgi:dephospho-CoA kinase